MDRVLMAASAANCDPSELATISTGSIQQDVSSPLVSPTMSRPGSVASGRSSIVSTMTVTAPNYVGTTRPSPEYISAASAGYLATESQSHSLASVSEDEDDSSDQVVVADGAVSLINAFLDKLLFDFLSAARSTNLLALKPAIADVLKKSLARDAIARAQDDVEDLLALQDSDDEEEHISSTLDKQKWNLEFAWKRARLRVMMRIETSDFDIDDDEKYVQEEGLLQGRQFSQARFMSLSAEIFLAGVLEFVAEQLLALASNGATMRARKQSLSVKADAGLTTTPRILVQEPDIEKAALNSPMDRLWRNWKKSLRSRGLGHQYRSTRSLNGSPTLTQHENVLVEETGMTPHIPDMEHPEHVIASNIPLPMSERDIDEINTPWLAKDPDEETNSVPVAGRWSWHHPVKNNKLLSYFSPLTSQLGLHGRRASSHHPTSTSFADAPDALQKRPTSHASSNQPMPTPYVDAPGAWPGETPMEKNSADTLPDEVDFTSAEPTDEASPTRQSLHDDPASVPGADTAAVASPIPNLEPSTVRADSSNEADSPQAETQLATDPVQTEIVPSVSLPQANIEVVSGAPVSHAGIAAAAALTAAAGGTVLAGQKNTGVKSTGKSISKISHDKLSRFEDAVPMDGTAISSTDALTAEVGRSALASQNYPGLKSTGGSISNIDHDKSSRPENVKPFHDAGIATAAALTAAGGSVLAGHKAISPKYTGQPTTNVSHDKSSRLEDAEPLDVRTEKPVPETSSLPDPYTMTELQHVIKTKVPSIIPDEHGTAVIPSMPKAEMKSAAIEPVQAKRFSSLPGTSKLAQPVSNAQQPLPLDSDQPVAKTESKTAAIAPAQGTEVTSPSGTSVLGPTVVQSSSKAQHSLISSFKQPIAKTVPETATVATAPGTEVLRSSDTSGPVPVVIQSSSKAQQPLPLSSEQQSLNHPRLTSRYGQKDRPNDVFVPQVVVSPADFLASRNLSPPSSPSQFSSARAKQSQPPSTSKDESSTTQTETTGARSSSLPASKGSVRVLQGLGITPPPPGQLKNESKSQDIPQHSVTRDVQKAKPSQPTNSNLAPAENRVSTSKSFMDDDVNDMDNFVNKSSLTKVTKKRSVTFNSDLDDTPRVSSLTKNRSATITSPQETDDAANKASLTKLTTTSITSPMDFDTMVQRHDTIKYTLTPERAREPPNMATPAQVSSRSRKRAGSKESSRSTGSKESSSITRKISLSSLDTDPVGQRPSRSSPSSAVTSSPASATPRDRKKIGAPLARKISSTARPEPKNAKPTARGHVAREPQVQTASTLDFADFIRTTGPDKDQAAPPKLNLLSTTSPSNLHSRDAKYSTAGNSADLIDFLRSGPAEQGGRQRYTMDSDATPTSITSVSPSVRSSMNSQVRLLPSSSTSTNPTATTQPAYVASSQRVLAEPNTATSERKRHRNKDPYYIDDSEDEDFLTALPKDRRAEESLMDFLRNNEPPKNNAPKPLAADGAAEARDLLQRARISSLTSLRAATNESSQSRSSASQPDNVKPKSPISAFPTIAPSRTTNHTSQYAGNTGSSITTISSPQTKTLRPTQSATSFMSAGGVPRNPNRLRFEDDSRITTGTGDLADFLKNSGPPSLLAPRSTNARNAPASGIDKKASMRFWKKKTTEV